jgi:hypothetical protein
MPQTSRHIYQNIGATGGSESDADTDARAAVRRPPFDIPSVDILQIPITV